MRSFGGPWGTLLVVCAVTGTVCLLLGTGNRGSALVPVLRGVMLAPSIGFIACGIAFRVTHQAKVGGPALVLIGLAGVGGALDYIVPDGPFLLLLLPGGIACLGYAGYLVLHPHGRAQPHRVRNVAAALLAAAGAFAFGLGGLD